MLPVTDIHSALREALPPAPAHFWTARDDAAHTVVVVVPNSQAATIALSHLTEFSVTHAALGELTFSVNATPNGPRSPDVLCFVCVYVCVCVCVCIKGMPSAETPDRDPKERKRDGGG